MERIYAFLIPTIKHTTNLQMKGIDLGKKSLAAALVMVTMLCVTCMDDDYTSANRNELGQGVLISNPIQTDGSMHNLQAGVFDWKIWGYVGDFAENVAKPVRRVVANVKESVEQIERVRKCYVAMCDFPLAQTSPAYATPETRTAMLMSSLDK